MGYPHGTVPTPPGVRVQPTPIYETVTMCLLAYFLWKLRDRVRPGVIFALYLVGSGLERFLVDPDAEPGTICSRRATWPTLRWS